MSNYKKFSFLNNHFEKLTNDEKSELEQISINFTNEHILIEDLERVESLYEKYQYQANDFIKLVQDREKYLDSEEIKEFEEIKDKFVKTGKLEEKDKLRLVYFHESHRYDRKFNKPFKTKNKIEKLDKKQQKDIEKINNRKFLKIKEIEKLTVYALNYSNEDNFSLTDWLIAMKYYLNYNSQKYQYIPTINYIYEEVEDNDIMKKFRSFTTEMVNTLRKIKTYGELSNFIKKHFDEEAKFGYNNMTNYFIDVSFFQFIYFKPKPSEVIGKAPRKTNKKYRQLFKGNFIVAEINTKNNNCLIDSIQFLLKDTKETANIINKKLKLLNDGVSSEKVNLLENYFKKNINIVIGENNYGDLNYAHKSEMKYEDAAINILWTEEQGGHYYPILEYNKIEQEVDTTENVNEKKERKNRYLFFDYETIYDPAKCDLMSYAVYCNLCESLSYDENKKCFIAPGQDNFFTGINSNRDFVEYLLKINNNEYNTFVIGYNSSRFDNFLLLEELAKQNLINQSSVFVANGSILRMNFLYFSTIDLCRFLNQPLKVALSGFKCTIKKGDFSHILPQRAFMVGGWFELMRWIENNNQKLYEYNRDDVLGLKELYYKVKAQISKISANWEGVEYHTNKTSKSYKINYTKPVEMEKYMTISSLCYDLWKNSIKATMLNFDQIHAAETLGINLFIRSSNIGGRSQIFKYGCFETPIQSLDVTSLYPFIMGCADLSYPIGSETIVKTIEGAESLIERGFLGVYHCRIVWQPDVKIIPEKIPGQPYNWTSNNSFDRVLNSNDIKVLREYGGVVNILLKSVDGVEACGVCWVQSSKDVFKEYVKVLAELKNKEDRYKDNGDTVNYNPAMRELTKMGLNSLSGKMGQREFNEEYKFCMSKNDELNFINSHDNVKMQLLPRYDSTLMIGDKNDYEYKKKKCKPWALMSFLYSYAREHMYKSILSKSMTKKATDTDSNHLEVTELEKLLKENEIRQNNEGFNYDGKAPHLPEPQIFANFTTGAGFGRFSYEIPFVSLRNYYIAPKCYGLFGNKIGEIEDESKGKENCKKKFKGVSKRDKFLELTQKNISMMLFGVDENIRDMFDKVFNNHYGTERLKVDTKTITKLFSFVNNNIKFDLMNSIKKTLCENVYHQLLNKEFNNTVIMLASRIEKKLGNFILAGLKNSFILKIIKFDDKNGSIIIS